MAELTLEATLDKIAAENNLTSIAIGRMPVGDRVVRTAIVHYAGYSRNGHQCSSGTSDASIHIALMAALTDAAQNRIPEIVGCDHLPTLADAA